MLASALPKFSYVTGTESVPIISDKTVSIEWLGGEDQGLLPESSAQMFQLELMVAERQGKLAQVSCKLILQALGLYSGSSPKAMIPYLDFSVNSVNGVDTGKKITLYLPGSKRWIPQGKESDPFARFNLLTVIADYTPI